MWKVLTILNMLITFLFLLMNILITYQHILYNNTYFRTLSEDRLLSRSRRQIPRAWAVFSCELQNLMHESSIICPAITQNICCHIKPILSWCHTSNPAAQCRIETKIIHIIFPTLPSTTLSLSNCKIQLSLICFHPIKTPLF